MNPSLIWVMERIGMMEVIKINNKAEQVLGNERLEKMRLGRIKKKRPRKDSLGFDYLSE